MAQGPTTGPARPRGRPARLSRERIVEAAVGLVYADPAEPLTLRRVAKAVDSAPMALYRYFPDRDDLAYAVADRVMAHMRFTPSEGASWQAQLREWMRSSLDHLRPYPHLLPFVASLREPAWLPSIVELTDVLGPLDLTDAEAALAVALIGATVVGQATLAARRPPAVGSATVMRGDPQRAPTEAGARLAAVLDNLPSALDHLFDLVVEVTVEAVEGIADGRPTPCEAADVRPACTPGCSPRPR
ncbi:TetR/AcrR family transcriptional regulator [Yinghuangia sp. YIM S09857]|uniref:TetR/AcrR family transcriptional regulator n=1 Tax=Yinghuangia sp. YIM S09857 TaxID=3436929 RepID=UPI003F52B1A0